MGGFHLGRLVEGAEGVALVRLHFVRSLVPCLVHLRGGGLRGSAQVGGGGGVADRRDAGCAQLAGDLVALLLGARRAVGRATGRLGTEAGGHAGREDVEVGEAADAAEGHTPGVASCFSVSRILTSALDVHGDGGGGAPVAADLGGDRVRVHLVVLDVAGHRDDLLDVELSMRRAIRAPIRALLLEDAFDVLDEGLGLLRGQIGIDWGVVRELVSRLLRGGERREEWEQANDQAESHGTNLQHGAFFVVAACSST